MPADEHLGLQFEYETKDHGGSRPMHRLTAHHEGEQVGEMVWMQRDVVKLEVEPEHQRQGVATSLWNEGHRMAAENARIPAPKHSNDRTTAGDAWAKAVGGRLPRRKRDAD